MNGGIIKIKLSCREIYEIADYMDFMYLFYTLYKIIIYLSLQMYHKLYICTIRNMTTLQVPLHGCSKLN